MDIYQISISLPAPLGRWLGASHIPGRCISSPPKTWEIQSGKMSSSVNLWKNMVLVGGFNPTPLKI
jgi:hypothetical protein